MRRYTQLAHSLANPIGGVGAVQIMPQQVGQPVSIMPQQVGIPAAMAAPQAQQAAVQYSGAAYKAGGLTYCGFGRTVIPAGAVNQAVQINVRRPFLPQLVYMPSTVFGLQIDDFQVEGTGLFASALTQGMPNELISEVSNIEQIQWPTLDPSTGGAFLVSNPTLGDLIFSGAFWGTNLIRA